MNKILGICNLHDSPSLGQLTKSRPLGAVSFLSRYALMDFALSNFSNSEIDRIMVLTEHDISAVLNHTQQGGVWINNTRTGFLRIVMNEKLIDSPKFNTDIANVESHYSVLETTNPEYVVVAPSFFLMSFDFRTMIEEHIDSGADITCLYLKNNQGNKEYINCDLFKLEDGKIVNSSTNAGTKKNVNVSLETYVFTRQAFDELLRLSHEVSSVATIRYMVSYMINHNLLNIKGFEFKGTVFPILTLKDYINVSFELLAFENRQKLFFDDWPIYTTTHNTPPALYGPKAKVKNSFVANGCIIKGTVEDSIISRGVVIEEGAVVKNCILFTLTKIGSNAKLQYVLTDKSVKVQEIKNLSGTKDELFIVKQGEKI